MKRKYNQAFIQEEQQPIKRHKLNDGTVKFVKHNYEQIQQLVSNQQRMIEEFGRIVSQLKEELNNSKKRIDKLEETVENQQLVLREVIPPTKFPSSPPSYYC